MVKDSKELNRKEDKRKIMSNGQDKTAGYVIIWLVALYLVYYFNRTGQDPTLIPIVLGLGIAFTIMHSKS